jgi:hypothetical protein
MSSHDRNDSRARLGAATRWPLLAGAAFACIVVIFGPGVPTAEPAAAPPDKLAPLAALSKRAGLAEEELRASLWKQSSEVVLDKKPKMISPGRPGVVVVSPVPGVEDREAPLTAGIRAFVAKRADLRGLPLAAEKDCQLSREAVAVLTKVGRKARELQTARDRAARLAAGRGRLADLDRALSDYLTDARDTYAKEPLAVGPLRQIFEAEGLHLRTELAETLRVLPGEEATRSLARLASFDLSPAVRKAAIKALKDRPAKEARPVFLAALRHVWAPAADHAAFALVELDDRAAVADLEKLLEAPAPDAPFKQGDKWVKRELVRVNHLRNCFLCHPPGDGVAEKGSLFAPVPAPGHQLPTEGYQGRAQPGSIRADVVYFRPDFSATHKIDKDEVGPWPEVQRFDYLVRTRELTKAEAEQRSAEPGGGRNYHPQLRAVKDALAELQRRKDAGPKK